MSWGMRREEGVWLQGQKGHLGGQDSPRKVSEN